MRRKYNKRLFTEKEFREASQIERMHMHLLEPDKWVLTETDAEKLVKLRGVWKIIMANLRPMNRIMAIVEGYSCTERYARELITEAGELFMVTIDFDAELERLITRDRYLKIHEKASKDGDYETAMKALEKADSILKEIEISKPKTQKVYAMITPTTDPTALELPTGDDENYLDYESILESQTEAILSENTAL